MARNEVHITVHRSVKVDTPKRIQALGRCLRELNDIAESAPWLTDKCRRVADELSGLLTVEVEHN